MKRLDTGEGSYARELEEDYAVYDAVSQVSLVRWGLSAGGCARAAMSLHRGRRHGGVLLAGLLFSAPPAL